MEFFVGRILPYIAAGVFLAGTCLRVIGWLRTPVPFHLTLFPVPVKIFGKIWGFASEFFIFRTLYRHDRVLWLLTLLFHVTLALTLAGHLFGIYFLREQFALFGLGPGASRQMSRILGGTAGIVMICSLGGLLYRRIAMPEVKRLSEPENFLALLLILAVALSGIFMYLPGYHIDLPTVRTYLGSLLSATPLSPPRNAPFVIHFVLVNILLLYFPFSRMMHSIGFFVIRTMLLETPPVYPTPANTRQRSVFAAKKVSPENPASSQTTFNREVEPR